MKRGTHRWTTAAALSLTAAVALVSAREGTGQQMASRAAVATSAPTFAKDVAPIIQQNCQTCHRPGSIGPMSLLTYEDAKAFAPLIKMKTQRREMPPWPLDKTVGIQEFKNDISLSDEEIATIAAWVDAGAPLGNPADMPPAIEWPDFSESWSYEKTFGRPPDLVVTSPTYTVVANGQDQFPDLTTKITELDQERWIKAIEIKPANPESRYVFHHAVGTLIAMAAGSEGQIFPANTGRLLRPGTNVSFGPHYWPTEKDVDAVIQLGLWFYPVDETPKFETRGQVQYKADISTGGNDGFARRGDLLIPPNGTAMYRGIHVLDQPARIHDLRGHMHLRGKYQVLEAIYPDGRWEVINKLNWAHAWHTTFIYEDHVAPLLPKGTVLITTSIFDNTAANSYNPDPKQWVVAGSRTVDEMSHMWIGMTFFENEEDFQALVREREQTLKQRAVAAAANDNQ
jgi:mono/diheme cytochrome c family protein